MRLMIWSLTLVTSLVLFAASAAADCWLDGYWYPEGTTYGSYICQDGKWVRR